MLKRPLSALISTHYSLANTGSSSRINISLAKLYANIQSIITSKCWVLYSKQKPHRLPQNRQHRVFSQQRAQHKRLLHLHRPPRENLICSEFNAGDLKRYLCVDKGSNTENPGGSQKESTARLHTELTSEVQVYLF